LTKLRAEKLHVNEPEEKQLQQLRDDAVGAVRRLRILSTSLSALGIEAALFEQYAQSATSFIASSRGSEAGLVEERYRQAIDASEKLNGAISRVAEVLGNRIATLDEELAPVTTALAS
jgi:hypothetical protein